MTKTFTPEDFFDRMRKRHDEKQKRLEKIKAVMPMTPVPYYDKAVDTITSFMNAEVQYLMRSHPGYTMAQKIASYRVARSILEKCIADMIQVVDDFIALANSNDEGLFDGKSRDIRDDIDQRALKEVFAVTNAAAAVVEHSRRIPGLKEHPERIQKMDEHFGTDGLKEFVISLRVLLHHKRIIAPQWEVQYMFTEGQTNPSFKLDKDNLLIAIDENLEAGERKRTMVFVQKHGDDIHLKPLFEEYRKRMRSYNEWLDAHFATETYAEAHDYERIMEEKRRRDSRQWWNNHLKSSLKKQSLDGYDALYRDLTPKEAKELDRLPRGSQEHTAKMISFLDREGAFDDALTAMFHELILKRAVSDDITSPSQPLPSCPPPTSSES